MSETKRQLLESCISVLDSAFSAFQDNRPKDAMSYIGLLSASLYAKLDAEVKNEQPI